MNILLKAISTLIAKLRRRRRARRRKYSPPVTDIEYDYTEVVRISPVYQPDSYLMIENGTLLVPSNRGLDHSDHCKLYL